MLFAFLLLISNHVYAITISGTETITTNSSASYTATGCSGTVSWGVTGTGASINSNGVLTAGAASCGAITVAAKCSDGSIATKQLRVVNAGQWTVIASCNNELTWQGLCGITNWQTCGNCQAWGGSALIINKGDFQATQFISQITRTSGPDRYTTRWYAMYENGTGCNTLIVECCPSYDSVAPIDHCCENVQECASYPYSHPGPDACLFSKHERWVCSSCTDNDHDGYTTCQGDCDDSNPNIKPSATEICGDLKDNNCNGQVDEGCDKILKYVSGSGQEDYICKTLQNPFVVSVSGATQSNVGVNWQITELPSGSNASIVGEATTFADSEITSSAYLKLGNLPGSYNAEARCSECTSGSPQKFTAAAKCPEVPKYYQGGTSSWAKDPYDKWCKYTDPKTKETENKICDYDENGNLKTGYEHHTIGVKGCALASVAMVMKWYEYELGGKFIDPVSLNGLMNDAENGYINGGFNFDKVKDVTSPDLLAYKKDSKDVNTTISKALMDEYLKKCIPVIVRVKNWKFKSKKWVYSWHYLVVTKKDSNDYLINDPGYSTRTTLSFYEKEYIECKDCKGGYKNEYKEGIYAIRVLHNKKGACEQ